MLSPLKSIRLRVVPRRLALFLVLLTLLVGPATPDPTGASAATLTSEEPEPAAAPTAAELPTFLVSWTITSGEHTTWYWANGDPSGIDWDTSITGYARVRATLDLVTRFFVDVPTLSLAGEYQHENWLIPIPGCLETVRKWNKEPQRYALTSRFAPGPYTLVVDKPRQKADGTWVMDEPMDITEGSWRLEYLHRYVDEIVCPWGVQFKTEYDFTSVLPIANNALFQPMELVGNSTATTFTGSTQYSVSNPWSGGTEQMRRTVTVTRLGACAGLPTPIDASFPLARNLLVTLEADPTTIPPNVLGTTNAPDPAVLRAKVTCDGVPIKNAEVRLTVTPRANSGGHTHNDAAYPRPRGYLRKQGTTNWTRLTEAAPTFTVKTGDAGIAAVEFRPGTDTRNQTRGIAGDYEIQAEVTHMAGTAPQQTIEVKRTDFVQVVAGDGYTMFRRGTETHPDGAWASATTAERIPELAADFRAAQDEHNAQLVAAGQHPWPIALISVNDISLPEGGLFDCVGWDVATARVTGTPWSPPHSTHLEGTGVDINHFAGPLAPQINWLSTTLDTLGRNYGGWANEPNLHLEFDQTARGSRTAAPGGLPDLTATALLLESNGLGSAAPGQDVTYTLGVDNMRGGAEAAGVVLSATLPAGLTYVSADPLPTSVRGGLVTWAIGKMPAGALPEVVSLAVRLANPLAPGTALVVTGKVTSGGPDANLSNNRQDAQTLTVQPALPDLVVTSDVASQSLVPGKPMTFTVTAGNYGTVAAPGTQLTLTLPVSVTLGSAAPPPAKTTRSSLTWALGELGRGQAGEVRVTVNVDPVLRRDVAVPGTGTPARTLPFVMNAASTLTDANPDSDSLEVALPVQKAGPDLWLALTRAGTGDPGTVIPGSHVVFTLPYGNAGNQLAASTVISLTLPAGLVPESADPPATRTGPGPEGTGTLLVWNTGPVARGDSGSITVHVRVASAPAEPTPAVAVIATPDEDLNPFDNLVLSWLTSGRSTAGNRLYLPLLRRN